MYCLKCGRETVEDKIFCEDCLIQAQMYPVAPGTPIQLPRPEAHAPKKSSAAKRSANTDEQVEGLKKTVRRMGILLVLAMIALALSLAGLCNII